MENFYNVKRLALILAVQAEIEGMKAENERAIQNGLNPPYGEEQFEKAMLKFPVDHNSIIDAFEY